MPVVHTEGKIEKGVYRMSVNLPPCVCAKACLVTSVTVCYTEAGKISTGFLITFAHQIIDLFRQEEETLRKFEACQSFRANPSIF